MNTHEHRWVYVFDALLHLGEKSKAEATGGSRVEYCVECSSMRVHLSGDKWAYLQGELTKRHLRKFERETNTPVKPPDEFRISKTVESRSSKSRLGRGISDLMKQVEDQGPLLRLVTNTPEDN